MNVTRRTFLTAVGAAMAGCGTLSAPIAPERFKTRGVVLYPDDLSLGDWPERASGAGLTTIALHHGTSPQAVADFVKTDDGQRFLGACRRLGLEVEYELHAMGELLPRDLFGKDPTMFRVNENGDRSPDFNCCLHSEAALDVITENALRLAELLRPTTGRYFLWGDDGVGWCRCQECGGLSDSDQALLLENALVRALRSREPEAQLAHIAYVKTLPPPTQVKPEPGVFLEYAPIRRRYDVPYADQQDPAAEDGLAALEANLEVFPREAAQALEYWLDVSRYSEWKRPGVKLPWNAEVFRRDVETYANLGLRHITTFATWIDAEYAERYEDLSFVDDYGRGLGKWGLSPFSESAPRVFSIRNPKNT